MKQSVWLYKGGENVLVDIGSEAEGLWRAKGFAEEGKAAGNAETGAEGAPKKATKPRKAKATKAAGNAETGAEGEGEETSTEEGGAS